jgi:hypothetical protein
LALTLGLRHVVTGSGQFAITQPVGLVVSVAGIPAYVARDPGLPTLYKRIGHINFGHAFGFQPPIELELVPQLVYPIAPEFTLLRYTLLAGETATIDELAGPAVVPSTLQPWDRNPTAFSMNGVSAPAGPATATLWTFTVPAGRKLFLATAQVQQQRVAAATSSAAVSVTIYRGNAPLCYSLDYTNTVGTKDRDTLSPGGLVLLAGEVLAASYNQTDVTGQHYIMAFASGFTFDA